MIDLTALRAKADDLRQRIDRAYMRADLHGQRRAGAEAEQLLWELEAIQAAIARAERDALEAERRRKVVSEAGGGVAAYEADMNRLRDLDEERAELMRQYHDTGLALLDVWAALVNNNEQRCALCTSLQGRAKQLGKTPPNQINFRAPTMIQLAGSTPDEWRHQFKGLL